MPVSDTPPAEVLGEQGSVARRIAQPAAVAPADQVGRLGALIREVDGSHSMGAAALAEALFERGVRFEDPGLRVYAAATVRADGTVEPVSNPLPTRDAAEQELAGLLGDDYYRDCRPFIATSVTQIWRPVDG